MHIILGSIKQKFKMQLYVRFDAKNITIWSKKYFFMVVQKQKLP
jgi:hypothetical protein